ncbi:hypothetical protein [Dulcicalothrix desertica]|nr:hypothetical protein [Dulcicalothrix desertica]
MIQRISVEQTFVTNLEKFMGKADMVVLFTSTQFVMGACTDSACEARGGG